MGAHRRSRIVRFMLTATTAAIILATALGPINSPGSAAKGNAHHGHAQHQEHVQHPQVASASNKRHTKNTKKGRRRHDQPGTIFNPPSPTAPSGHSYTETRTFEEDCIAWPDTGDSCSVDLVEFSRPAPVQIEAVPTLPCGRATVSAVGWITGTGDTHSLERQDIPSGVSTGVLDLGTVKSFSVQVYITNFEGCGPIQRTRWDHTLAVTYSYTSPDYLPVLTP
jgi:hypothetical protein